MVLLLHMTGDAELPIRHESRHCLDLMAGVAPCMCFDRLRVGARGIEAVVAARAIPRGCVMRLVAGRARDDAGIRIQRNGCRVAFHARHAGVGLVLEDGGSLPGRMILHPNSNEQLPRRSDLVGAVAVGAIARGRILVMTTEATAWRCERELVVRIRCRVASNAGEFLVTVVGERIGRSTERGARSRSCTRRVCVSLPA